MAPSSFDGKGGGGGGGGGAVAIHSLGEIVVKSTGRILARGGRGGGGEANGCGNLGGCGGGGAGGAIILNSSKKILIEHFGDQRGILDVSGGWGGDASMQYGTASGGHLKSHCKILEQTGGLKWSRHFCTWSPAEGGYGGYGLIQLMVPDPFDPAQLDFIIDSTMATVCKIEHEPNFEKSTIYYKGEPRSYARYNFTVEGLGPGGTKPYVQFFPYTSACLVPPEKTISTVNPITYAVSKWIDMGRVVDRPLIGGVRPPVFLNFEGIRIEKGWGVVNTNNGYVLNAHLPGFNDIDVDSPDLNLADYIPDSNEVAIQFQGTEAVIPGAKVPSVAPGALTDWTWDLASLSGKQFVRFRVRFDVAKGGDMTPKSPKPQVNKVRLRLRY
jgi:hypothetical protein